jgi:hypothetical protein
MNTGNVVEDLDQVVEQYHRALGEFMQGDHEPAKRLFSERDDVTLGNPFGPFARGLTQVVETMKRAASHYRDGDATGFETISKYVTPDLAYIVEVERLRPKVGGRDDVSPVHLRVTSNLPQRRRQLETRPSARRSNNHRAASGIHTAAELGPLSRVQPRSTATEALSGRYGISHSADALGISTPTTPINAPEPEGSRPSSRGSWPIPGRRMPGPSSSLASTKASTCAGPTGAT